MSGTSQRLDEEVHAGEVGGEQAGAQTGAQTGGGQVAGRGPANMSMLENIGANIGPAVLKRKLARRALARQGATPQEAAAAVSPPVAAPGGQQTAGAAATAPAAAPAPAATDHAADQAQDEEKGPSMARLRTTKGLLLLKQYSAKVADLMIFAPLHVIDQLSIADVHTVDAINFIASGGQTVDQRLSDGDDDFVEYNGGFGLYKELMKTPKGRGVARDVGRTGLREFVSTGIFMPSSVGQLDNNKPFHHEMWSWGESILGVNVVRELRRTSVGMNDREKIELINMKVAEKKARKKERRAARRGGAPAAAAAAAAAPDQDGDFWSSLDASTPNK